MKRLILFRHAKTERRAPSGEDFDRRLTERGRGDARLMGQVLAKAGYAPDHILVSEAVRAQETWEAAKGSFPETTRKDRPELYTADVRDIVNMVRKCPAETVMVLAHNPAMHALALSLLEQSGDGDLQAQIREGFPTAAIAVFDMAEEGPKALGLYVPRNHGGGGGSD